MFKAFFGLIRLFFLTFVLLLVFHNLAARLALSGGLRYALGMPVEIESASVDFLKSQVSFHNLLIKNPQGLPEGYLMKVDFLMLDLDLRAFFDGRMGFKRIETDIRDFQIVRSQSSEINWLKLKQVQNFRKNTFSKRETSIGHFVLSIRRGTYQDFSKPNFAPQSVAINLDRQDYLGVHTIDDIVKLISWEALKRMGMEKLGAGVLDQVKEDLSVGQKK